MDTVIRKAFLKNWIIILQEYERVKRKESKLFKNCCALYAFYGTSAKQVNKYYSRWLNSNKDTTALLPRKRGTKHPWNQISANIEKDIVSYRKQGYDRYEIVNLLRPKYQVKTPSPATIYRVTRRHGLSKLYHQEKEAKIRYCMQNPGELGHLDIYYVPKTCFLPSPELKIAPQFFLLGLLDDHSRIVWLEVLESFKAVPTMFAALRLFNWFLANLKLKFKAVLTDWGGEFTAINPQGRDHHIFEIALKELGIQHKYCRPNHPQTNGKIERFWKTLEQEFILPNQFFSKKDFQEKLYSYLDYYNTRRIHQGIDQQTPYQRFSKKQKVLPN